MDELDRDVSAPQSLSTRRLLRAVQNRIWLQGVLDVAVRAAWAGAVIAMLGSAVHLAVLTHSGRTTAILAVLLLGVPIAFALLRGRPALTMAARSADTWFDGRALMTSACDQLSRPEAKRAGAAAFVLEQADARAAAWQRRLRAVRPLVGARRLHPAFACLLLGAFLHLLPGATSPHTAGRDARLEVARATPPARPASPASQHASDSGAVRTDGVAQDPEPGATRGARADVGVAVPERGRGPATRATPEAGGTSGGREVGHAAPESELGPVPPDAGPQSFELTEIARPAGHRGAGSGLLSGAPGERGAAASMGPVAPATPIGVAAREQLAPVMRAYVSRYLESLEEERR